MAYKARWRRALGNLERRLMKGSEGIRRRAERDGSFGAVSGFHHS